jgi:hypothetical protein
VGRDRSRVLVLLVAYLASLIVGTLVMDWFTVGVQGLDDGMLAQTIGAVRMSIGLHDMTMCTAGMPCVSIGFSGMGKGVGFGWYGTFAAMTMYGGLAVGLLVTFQAVTRVRSGFANEALTKLGSFGCIYVFGTAGAAGYLFAPDGGGAEQMGVALTVHRTWGPALTLIAQVLGLFALYHASNHETADDVAPYVPVVIALPADRAKRSSDPVPTVAKERLSSDAIATAPEAVRGKLSFATLTAELTRGGIDARREDDTTVLVMWRDVVGVVARRLPPEHGGTTFIDLVSTAGSTLRVLPWTRLTGDPVDGDGDARARTLVALVAERCPEAKLDPATRAFLDGKDAAQLPDLATLAAHDQRLA